MEEDPRTMYFSVDTNIVDPRLLIRNSFVSHFPPAYLGLGFRQDSEFTEFFNRHILKAVQGGVLEKINFRWVGSRLSRKDRSAPASASPVSFRQLLFPVLVLAGGASASVAVALIETCASRYVRRKKKKNRRQAQENREN